MPLQFTISPDFNANQLSHWFIVNTRLQHLLDAPSHLELYDHFEALRQAAQDGKVGLVFANAYDTAILVREKGFIPVARAITRSDEALIAVAQNSPHQKITDFRPGLKVACTSAPDIEMIGRILLEPADLDHTSINMTTLGNYVLVAKALLNGDADAGFFLRDSFHELSGLVRNQLRPLVNSHIYVIQHAWLLSPDQAALRPKLLGGLLSMKENPKDLQVLQDLGYPEGWQEMSTEDAEFMIDMMDALLP